MTIRRSGAILLVLLVAGCGIMKRPKNQFWSLDTIPGTPRTVGGVPLGVDGIQLPPAIDRRGITVRGTGNKIDERGTHQWASPLEEMVVHTLSFDLASRLTNGMVVLPGQAKPAAMRSLYVTFEDLAPGPDNVFVLDARWVITGTGVDEMAGHERITINLTSLDNAEIVSAMSTALGTLADRIVAAL
ncbi:MAG TPA: PqiC family protein [Thermoanaerobaculia bacterium]|jgi:uncharacterized lipoprotein YmbA